MALAFVQGNHSNTNSVAYTGSNTLGNLLVCAVWTLNPSTTCTVADTQGNTWVPVSGQPYGGVGAGDDGAVSAFYCVSAKAGANTVTATGGSQICVMEYSGGAFVFDASNGIGNNYPTGSSSNCSVVYSHAVCVVAALAYQSRTISPTTLSGGMTIREQSTFLICGDVFSSSPGTTTSNVSGGGFTAGVIMLAIAGAQPIVVATCPTPNTAVTGTVYSASSAISGGSAPYTASISSGALPSGTQVGTTQADTGCYLTITGTPLSPGTYNFNILVTDNLGLTTTISCSITVTGADLSCPCGALTGITLTSISDWSAPSGTTLSPEIDYDFPLGCDESFGCDLGTQTGLFLLNPLASICASGGSANPNTPVAGSGFAGRACTSDLFSLLTTKSLATLVGTLDLFAGNTGFLYWTGGSVATYAAAAALFVRDLYLTLTYSNGGLKIIRPTWWRNQGGGPGSNGQIIGTGFGAGIFQWHTNGVDWPPYQAFGGFTVPATVPACGSTVTCCGNNFPPVGYVGVAYTFTFTGTGGTAPYTFTLLSGALPTSLSLASGGAVTGTPTVAGTYSFILTVTDSLSASYTFGCSITILAASPTITCGSIYTNAPVSTLYSASVAVVGGAAPYTFAVTAGALPTGLALNTSTGAITGTPTATGAYSFTIRVTDANGNTASVTCGIIIITSAGNGVQSEFYLWQIQDIADAVYNWRSQFISHGRKGYQHVPEILATYSSSAPVTLTFSVFDGTAPASISLPSTGGAVSRILIRPTYNKFRLIRYTCASTQPFQILLSDWLVKVGEWGRTGTYVNYQLVGEG